MFIHDNPLVRARAQESVEGMVQVYALCSTSIRKQTPLLLREMDKFRELGLLGAPELQWGNKRKGALWMNEHKQEHFDGMKKIIRSKKKEDELNMILHWLQVPGLGLPKAGFMTQLVMGKGGCMDVHNIRKYLPEVDSSKGTPNRWQTSGQSEETKKRKAVDYLSFCKLAGGAKGLWDQWCDFIAEQYPDAFESGDHVSKLHPIWVS